MKTAVKAITIALPLLVASTLPAAAQVRYIDKNGASQWSEPLGPVEG